MPRRGLTRNWSIDLDESFKGRVKDGDLQLVSPGPPVRTIWVAVWSPPPDQSPDATIENILRHAHPAPRQRFQEAGADQDELRYASWYDETVGERHQWGLYAYTVRRGTYVQAAFLVDEPADLDWALAAWRSLRFES
jgi:hypothetical protein